MEEKDFFREAIKNCKSNKELTKIYNFIMHKKLSVDCVRKKANKYGYHIKDNIDTKDLKSEESLKWIEENKIKYKTTTELHKAYNNYFNTNVKHASFIYNLKSFIKSKKKIEYTKEETQWFIENTHKYYSRYSVKEAFNKEFGENLTIDDINCKIGYMKLHTSKKPKKVKQPKEKKPRILTNKQKEIMLKNIKSKQTSIFSLEQQEWLKKYTNEFSTHKDLYTVFQKIFKTNFALFQIIGWVHRQKLKLKKIANYSKKEIEWLLNNYNGKLSNVELSKEFKKEFNKKINPHTLKTICNRNKIFKDKENYAQNVPKLPIGTEKNFNGRVFIKVDNKKGNRFKRTYHSNWVEKHRLVWEKENGKIPKGHYLCFKDGNSLNCEISNLFLTTPSELIKLVKNKVYGYNEYTEAYLDIIRIENELLKEKN